MQSVSQTAKIKAKVELGAQELCIGENAVRRDKMNIYPTQISHPNISLQSNYIPRKLKRKVLVRDRYRCVFCGLKFTHPKYWQIPLCRLIPRCRGGATKVNNLAVCCDNCRRMKRYKTPLEFFFEHEFNFGTDGFIKWIELEEVDIYKEVRMDIRVHMLNGHEHSGKIEDEHEMQSNKLFLWLRKGDNGKRIMVPWCNVEYVEEIEAEKIAPLPH